MNGWTDGVWGDGVMCVLVGWAGLAWLTSCDEQSLQMKKKENKTDNTRPVEDKMRSSKQEPCLC